MFKWWHLISPRSAEENKSAVVFDWEGVGGGENTELETGVERRHFVWTAVVHPPPPLHSPTPTTHHPPPPPNIADMHNYKAWFATTVALLVYWLLLLCSTWCRTISCTDCGGVINAPAALIGVQIWKVHAGSVWSVSLPTVNAKGISCTLLCTRRSSWRVKVN